MATANGSSKGTDEVEKQLKDRMVATGEWSRSVSRSVRCYHPRLTVLLRSLVKLLKDKLAGSAWEDGLRSEAEGGRLSSSSGARS